MNSPKHHHNITAKLVVSDPVRDKKTVIS